MIAFEVTASRRVSRQLPIPTTAARASLTHNNIYREQCEAESRSAHHVSFGQMATPVPPPQTREKTRAAEAKQREAHDAFAASEHGLSVGEFMQLSSL